MSDIILEDADYDPRYDGAAGEKLLGLEGSQDRTDISAHNYNNNYVMKVTQIKETKEEQNQSRPSTSDSEDTSLDIDWDSEKNHSSRLVKWIIEERRRRKVERSMLDLYRRRINHERSNLEKEKQDFASAEDDLARRIYQVKDLLPIADEMKRLGLDFTIANSWLICIKEMAQRKGLTEKEAAWKLVDMLRVLDF